MSKTAQKKDGKYSTTQEISPRAAASRQPQHREVFSRPKPVLERGNGGKEGKKEGKTGTNPGGWFLDGKAMRCPKGRNKASRKHATRPKQDSVQRSAAVETSVSSPFQDYPAARR